jgi:uncharacterized protein (TIGR02588 family)
MAAEPPPRPARTRRRPSAKAPPKSKTPPKTKNLPKTKKDKGTGKAKGAGAKRGTTPWEWAAAGVGVVILAGIVGYLIYEGIAGDAGEHPDIKVVGGAPKLMESGLFLVPITVTNSGELTGAEVGIVGTLRDRSGGTIEESRTTFDFVPQRSEGTGGLYFTADPGKVSLELRVEGYTDP